LNASLHDSPFATFYKELGHLANKRNQVIGEHFWCEPPQENESRTVIGLFRERNVCRFEAAAWGRGALRDSGPSDCEGDYPSSEVTRKPANGNYKVILQPF